MKSEAFRKIALSFPDVEEKEHHGHPDFRVGGKIFATLGYPRFGWGVVMLKPTQQKKVVARDPKAFIPVKGIWGRKGSTMIHLSSAKNQFVRNAMGEAWKNKAPRQRTKNIDVQ